MQYIFGLDSSIADLADKSEKIHIHFDILWILQHRNREVANKLENHKYSS
jgi:hypothetical protein